MGFKAKAMVICAVFIVPILTLGWNFFKSNADAIAFSAKERLGVEYARELMPLMALAHAQRNVAVGVAPTGNDASGHPVSLGRAAQEARRRGRTAWRGTRDHQAPLRASARPPRFRAGASGDPPMPPTPGSLMRLLALLGQSTDGSNLTLDPDIDSYYVMDAALFRNPQMIDLADRMRGTGTAVLAAGSGKPEQMAVIYDAAPVFGYHLDNLKGGLAKSIAYNGDVASPLNEKQAVEKLSDFISLVRSSLLATSGPKGIAPRLSARPTLPLRPSSPFPSGCWARWTRSSSSVWAEWKASATSRRRWSCWPCSRRLTSSTRSSSSPTAVCARCSVTSKP